MTYHIRRMGDSDITAARNIVLALWGGPRVERNLEEELAEGHWNVAEHWLHGIDRVPKIVGCAGWKRSPINYDIADIIWVNVDAAYHRMGIGRSFMLAAETAMRLEHFKLVMLTTHLPNVFQKYGFRILDVFHLAHGEAALMVKELI